MPSKQKWRAQSLQFACLIKHKSLKKYEKKRIIIQRRTEPQKGPKEQSFKIRTMVIHIKSIQKKIINNSLLENIDTQRKSSF